MMGGPRTFKTGTGRIRGRVLASDGAGPIRRAQVRISGSEVAPKAALTDAEGRFEFRELPAGRFTLQATKSGFVSVQYGQTRPFESGKPIELADKQSLDNADISMPRGSVIAGRIVDEFGDAIPDVSVTAMRQTLAERAAPAGALSRPRRPNQRPRSVPHLRPAAGRLLRQRDAAQRPASRWSNMEVMGGRRHRTSAGPTASAPKSGYASTYYPGTPNVAEAQRITLAAGQESPSADFALVAVRLAKVSGIVIGSDGKPLEGAAVSDRPGQS